MSITHATTFTSVLDETHFRFWTPSDRLALKVALDFDQLADVALRVIRRMPPKVEMISAPISTGKRTKEENRKIARNVIAMLAANDLNIFSQLPFEDKIVEFDTEWRGQGNTGYYWDILTIFYHRIFNSGLISKLHFVPGWIHSTGATWEYHRAPMYNIKRAHVPEEAVNLALVM